MQTSSGKKKEIAILGGAFDPVTNGHLQIAEYVLLNSKLFHEVWLMPCYSHIYNKRMSDSKHRLKMCRLATKNLRRIKTFDYEIKKQITNGTYHVMQTLLAEKYSQKKYNYSMIIGQDNADTFHHWIKYDLLEKLIRFIVVPRKGVVRDKQVSWYLQPPHLYLTQECNIMEISSTKVRNLIQNSQIDEVKSLINNNVLDYILKHKLYQA